MDLWALTMGESFEAGLYTAVPTAAASRSESVTLRRPRLPSSSKISSCRKERRVDEDVNGGNGAGLREGNGRGKINTITKQDLGMRLSVWVQMREREGSFDCRGRI